MSIKYNTPTQWGLKLDDFETKEWGNVIGSFKVPTSYLRRMIASYPKGDTETDDVYNIRIKTKMFNNLAQVYIDGISLYFPILRQVEFSYLLETDKEELRELIYEAVQHAVLNREVFEQINSSNIQQGGLQINNQTTGWLLTINMYGKRAWSKLHNSDISKYKLVGDDFFSKLVRDGDTEVVIAQWDNQTFKNNLGNYSSVSDAISDFTTNGIIPVLYDYFTVTDVYGAITQYRLNIDASLWTTESNWGVVDHKIIEGTKYLVKNKLVLASSQGKQGEGIASSSYDQATGILTLTFTDGTIQTTNDLRGHNTMDDAKITAAEQEVANV